MEGELGTSGRANWGQVGGWEGELGTSGKVGGMTTGKVGG